MAIRKSSRNPNRGPSRKPKKIQVDFDPDKDLHYKNIELLRKLTGSQGQVLSRRRTGLDAHHQRLLKTAIKRARHLALLPFVG